MFSLWLCDSTRIPWKPQKLQNFRFKKFEKTEVLGYNIYIRLKENKKRRVVDRTWTSYMVFGGMAGLSFLFGCFWFLRGIVRRCSIWSISSSLMEWKFPYPRPAGVLKMDWASVILKRNGASQREFPQRKKILRLTLMKSGLWYNIWRYRITAYYTRLSLGRWGFDYL